LNAWGGAESDLPEADGRRLEHPQERALLQRLSEFPEIVANAARDLAPHLLAQLPQGSGRRPARPLRGLPVPGGRRRTQAARLSLIAATRQVLQTGLGLLGVSAPTKM
jgi:arginyl-tRNA synthetase